MTPSNIRRHSSHHAAGSAIEDRRDATRTYLDIENGAIEPISSFRRFSTAGMTPKKLTDRFSDRF